MRKMMASLWPAFVCTQQNARFILLNAIIDFASYRPGWCCHDQPESLQAMGKSSCTCSSSFVVPAPIVLSFVSDMQDSVRQN